MVPFKWLSSCADIKGEGARAWSARCSSSKTTASRLRVSSSFLATSFAAPVAALFSICCTGSPARSKGPCIPALVATGLKARMIMCVHAVVLWLASLTHDV